MQAKIHSHDLIKISFFFRESVRLIKKKFHTLISFVLVNYALSHGLVIPLVKKLLHYSCRLAGLSYISNATFKTWVLSPLSLPILLFCIAVLAFISLAQMSGLVRCFDSAYRDKELGFSELVYFSFCDALQIFKPRNIPIILFVLLVIPTTNIINISGTLQKLYIPEFINSFILASDPLTRAKKLLVIFLWAAAVFGCFSIHFFTLKRKFALASFRESFLFLRKRLIKVIFGLFLWNIAVAACLVLICLATCGAAALVCKLTLSPSEGYELMYTLLYWIPAWFYGIYSLCAAVLSFAYLAAVFQAYRPNELVFEPAFSPKLTRFALLKTVNTAVVIFSLAASALSFYFSAGDFYAILRASENMPQITAHRGSSEKAPENSLPAFEAAMYDCADWIELDVHQTKDGVIVVTHDSDLYRITGKHVNIYDLTYEEALEYDVGKYFSYNYSGLKIATLEEAIELCRGKAKLNIELKPTGYEENFEAQVIAIVKKYGIENECLLASTDAETLKNIKAEAPEIATLYNMVIAEGDISMINFADCFSVEETSVTQELIDTVHAAGKEIFVWTVNDTNSMRTLADMGVNNIVTDIPWTARWALGNDRYDKIAAPLLKYVFLGEGLRY